MKLEDFYLKLELQVELLPVERWQAAHVAELMAHSHEFNLNGQTRSVSEIKDALDMSGTAWRVIMVRDRFGDYGAAGTIALTRHNDTLNVDIFVLNCRVLGKGVEQETLRQVQEIAHTQGASQLCLHYQQTPRNSAAYLFLKSLDGNALEADPEILDLAIPVAGKQAVVTNSKVAADKRETESVTDFVGTHLAALDPVKRAELYSRIATEWHTGAAIVSAIRARRQQARPDSAPAYVAPRSETEKRVAAVWSEVLNLSPIGANDDFFQLGGHSLLGTRLISRLHDEFHLDLGLACLFHSPTVAGLAAYIDSLHGRATDYTVLPAVVEDSVHRYDPFPLTDVQQAYWLGRNGSFELGNIACHVYTEVKLTDFDLARFKDALNRLIARHDMLRAVILPDGRQQILPELPPYKVALVDLRELDAESVAARLDAIRSEMSHQVLPTDSAPLFEVRAARLTDHITRLYFSIDVLILDARSLDIFYEELAALYDSPEAELAPLTLSFRDYILAANELEKSDQYRRAQEYWQGRLATLPPAPELPMAVSPSAVRSPRFVRRHDTIAPDAWKRLKEQAAQAGITPSGILLAAFADVLATWSKSPRFTIDLTLYNRLPLHTQVDALLGDFTSTTLLAVDQSAALPFVQRAKKIQTQLWEDLDHRAYSGVRVLREMGRQQGGAANAAMPVIFNSTLNMETASDARRPVSRLGEVGFAVNQTPQVSLDNQVSEDGGALVINWDVVEELFPAGMIDDMFEAYRDLLQRLAAEPAAWQAVEHGLLPAAQRELRARVNGTTAPIPTGLLHEPFLRQAEIRPYAPAIITSRRTLTYDEVARRARTIAHDLRQAGAKPNTLIAIVMEKGWEQVVAAFAILEAGAAFLPIDAALPTDRIHLILQHGEVAQVLTQSWVDNRVEWPANVRRIRVDEVAAPVASAVDEVASADVLPRLAPAQSPDDLAYVIYTSGSTGQPKGVMIDHRGALNTCLDINTRFDVTAQDRVLALSSLSFDLSVYDIFGMLGAGGAVVIPDASTARDPADWAELVERTNVTIWNSVPALMQLYVDYAEQQEMRIPQSLRVVMMSGDWIPVSLPDRIRRLQPTVELYSLGGATEASIWSIIYPIGGVNPAWTSIPYGMPMVNQTFYVLNEMLEPCPTWVTGQLFIGGIGLAKGYWHDEAKTNARFFIHPRTGERLYNAGDLGRYLPDGNIEFLGREDFQVKIQGFRIELGEIEAVLAQHPTVRTAVVTAVGERHQNKHLVGYVVPQSGQTVDPAGLKRYLQGKLPDYMVPAIVMPLDQLPLSSNGKVDRRALPAPVLDAETDDSFVAPRNPIEEMLAEIWKEDLGISQIGIHDNVFELGGDSLIGTRAILRIRQAFQVNVPVRSLFDAPTIAELAQVVEQLILQEMQALPASEMAD